MGEESKLELEGKQEADVWVKWGEVKGELEGKLRWGSVKSRNENSRAQRKKAKVIAIRIWKGQLAYLWSV